MKIDDWVEKISYHKVSQKKIFFKNNDDDDDDDNVNKCNSHQERKWNPSFTAFTFLSGERRNSSGDWKKKKFVKSGGYRLIKKERLELYSEIKAINIYLQELDQILQI